MKKPLCNYIKFFVEESKVKRLIFNFVFFLLVLLGFVGLEFILRVLNIGYSTDPFVRHPKIKDFYMDNRSLRLKYYPKSIDLTHDPIKNLFLYYKPADILRGIVIGGSAAEGFPYYSNHSFSKILEVALNEIKRYKKVEVINLGFSAMSSYYEMDVSKKLLKYNPDFIVIYSGHNEYYGTISATTGGNHFTKKIYLLLKELRIFQLIFEVLGQSKWKEIKSRTMMAEQFNNRIIPKNEKLDLKVAEIYVKNIKEIVDFFTRRDVNVILVEPVCNILSMPPFKGENDPFISNKILSLYKLIGKGDKKLFESELENLISFTNNANIRYICALYNMIYKRDKSISNFIHAKDLDIVPFRERSTLHEELRKFSFSYRKNQKFYFVNLPDRILTNFGINGFGNDLFIDHLHFNFKGHVVMASVLAQKIADIYDFNKNEREALISFFQNPDLIKEKIYLTPLHEFLAFRSILLLSKQPPYSDMILKYTPPVDPQNYFFANKEAYNLSEDELINKKLNEYVAKKDFKNAFFYMNSVLVTYPSEAKNYLAMAELQKMAKDESALYNYITAYVLSDRDYNYYIKMKDYLLLKGLEETLQKVISIYGEPKNPF